jgi:hypothetical protein
MIKKLDKKPLKSVTTERAAVMLADEPIEPCTDLSQASFLIHGDRKIGKTSLLAEFPDPYFLMFEQGGKFLRIRQTYIESWDYFLDVLDALEQKFEANPEYAKTIIIDPGYLMYERCFEYILRINNITDVRDEGWGNGWKMVEAEFRKQNTRLLHLPAGYVVIAHTDVEERTTPSGVKFSKNVTQLQKQARKWFEGFVDIITYYTYDDFGKRIMRIRGSKDITAGVRVDVDSFFKYSNGNRIETIGMGNTAKQAYKNFTLGFSNQLVAPKEGGVIKKK